MEEIEVYHNVFTSIIANYINLKKEIDSATHTSKLDSSKKGEALSLLKSLYMYSVRIKPDAPENINIPKDTEKFVAFVHKKIDDYKAKNIDYLDAFFVETVDKMRIAGLCSSQGQILQSRIAHQLQQEIGVGL